MQLHPQGINGQWAAGIVLDWHTVGSQIVGHNEFGYPIFDNTRSEIGELLYRFKYKNDQTALDKILKATIQYLGDKSKGKFDLIVPIPPSNPTRVVTKKIAQGLAIGFAAKFSDTALQKIKSTSELKSVTDPEIRKAMLSGAFLAEKNEIKGKRVLLVDDLYRSGATLEAAAEVVMAQGNAQAVYVLAITRTRVHR
ncbi:MAG: ComF family protein [Pseudomonadales bacterium]|nr:ComF family protein [Pseudomonadales bacterium]